MKDELEGAKIFATHYHVTLGRQTYACLPYTHHLQDVERTLREFGETRKTLLEAAWLHDVLEDTPAAFDEVLQVFGKEVADLVYAVTNEPGANRKERHKLTYPKIKAAGPDAIRLKLADRISNVRASLASESRLLKMYVNEHYDFCVYLYYYRDDLKPMWDELEILISKGKDLIDQRDYGEQEKRSKAGLPEEGQAR